MAIPSRNQSPPSQPTSSAKKVDAKKLSGKHWVTWANTHAKNSNQVSALSSLFQPKVKAFIKALETAGATVKVTTTKRDPKRAYLFHWCWKIGLGKAKAKDAGTKVGVDIEWDHGDDGTSKTKAKEMITGFGLAVPPKSTNAPSLTSHHIAGNAIDMTITWSGTIEVAKKDGKKIKVTYSSNPNTNANLHAVGESYGVKKLKTDAPHWSSTGN